jgi:CO/xanthine dehydrogenase Mo-binding subunit
MNAPLATRRSILAGGSLTLLFSLSGPQALGQPAPAGTPPGMPGDLARNRELDSWIRIARDGAVTLKTGKVELGQGILTAFGQICADELDLDLGQLEIVSGDTRICPREGVTAGSFSMPEGGTAVRFASAEVRKVLLDLAAKRLRAPAARLTVSDGLVTDPASGRHIAYGALVDDQTLRRPATGEAKPKRPGAHRYVGRATPRRDLPAKLTGEEIFVQDLKAANLVHGRMVRPPSYGASLQSVDSAPGEAMPGVLKVVRDGDVLGVIARGEWEAIKAAEALAKSAVWQETAELPPDPWAWLQAQPVQPKSIKDQARPSGLAPVRTLEAVYRRPYQMHASIGPSCAVAEMRPEGLLIHTHSQSVFETSAAIARMLGLEPEKVQARHMHGSGCYGHNGADDAAADAAMLARALPGKAVRVVWSRADEHGWEPYGSAMITKLRAGLDEKGDVLDWSYELWSTSHGTRPSGDPGNLLPGRSLAKPFPMPTPVDPGGPNYAAARNAIPLYDFPGQSITSHFVTAMPIRVSSTRSLGAYANVFSIESFMDELAHAAGADPVDYRLRQLKDPRGQAVIRAAADRFGWAGWKRGPNLGRGVAFARYKNLATYLALCLEVEVDPSTFQPRARRVVIAADAGEIVNPDGLKNQLEGGLIQALSWSLKEEVRHDGRRITTRDWASYPILRFSEVPDVEVVMIDRPGEPFLGAGEASQGPASAALANAIFDACGARVRDLPLTAQRIAVMRTRQS